MTLYYNSDIMEKVFEYAERIKNQAEAQLQVLQENKSKLLTEKNQLEIKKNGIIQEISTLETELKKAESILKNFENIYHAAELDKDREMQERKAAQVSQAQKEVAAINAKIGTKKAELEAVEIFLDDLRQKLSSCEELITNANKNVETCNEVLQSMELVVDKILEYSKGEENKEKVLISNDGVSEDYSNTYKMKIGDREWLLPNTKGNLFDYADWLEYQQLYQNAGYRDNAQCNVASAEYVVEMSRGTFKSKNNRDSLYALNRLDIELCSNQDELKEKIYETILSGYPCTIDSTQVFTSVDGSKHVVTVVGIDASVTCAAELTPDKILVLDCVDGKIQPLGLSREYGGHERDFFTQRADGRYAISIPSEKFINEEVNNENYNPPEGRVKPEQLTVWQSEQADEERNIKYDNSNNILSENKNNNPSQDS